MGHAVASLTGLLKGGKIEVKDGKEYYKGLLCISPNMPGILIEVYGKKIEVIKEMSKSPIAILGDCRLEEKASTQKIDKDLIVNVKSIISVEKDWFSTVFNEQYFVNEHCSLKIMGIMGRDPSVKFFESGKAKADFSLAVSQGKNSTTSWFECEAWDKTASIVGDYVAKGNALSIPFASPKIEEWEPKEGGETRRKWKFIVQKVDLHSRKENGESNQKESFEKLQSMPSNREIVEKIDEISLDEMPF
jgi:single-strand DNA-binding protein